MCVNELMDDFVKWKKIRWVKVLENSCYRRIFFLDYVIYCIIGEVVSGWLCCVVC